MNPRYLLTLLVIIPQFITFVTSDYTKLEWVPASQFNKDQQEVAGFMGSTRVYVARVEVGSGHLMGKYDPENKIHVVVKGRSTDLKLNGQILVYPKGAVTWTLRKRASTAPTPNLVLGGFDPVDLEPVYVCRGLVGDPKENKIIPGSFKFSQQDRGCYIGYDGAGIHVDNDYELLSLSFLGIATGAAAD